MTRESRLIFKRISMQFRFGFYFQQTVFSWFTSKFNLNKKFKPLVQIP